MCSQSSYASKATPVGKQVLMPDAGRPARGYGSTSEERGLMLRHVRRARQHVREICITTFEIIDRRTFMAV